MSNPDGFMIEGRIYPANSIHTEVAMNERIKGLEAERVDALLLQQRYIKAQYQQTNRITELEVYKQVAEKQIAQLEAENAQLNEAIKAHVCAPVVLTKNGSVWLKIPVKHSQH